MAGKRKAFFEMLNGFGGDARVARKALFAQWTPQPSATDAKPARARMDAEPSVKRRVMLLG